MGIMIFPVVETRIEKAFKEVDENFNKSVLFYGDYESIYYSENCYPLCRDRIISARI